LSIVNYQFEINLKSINTERFIAWRFIFDKSAANKGTPAIINIAVASIAVGLIIVILADAILTGFKTEIREKVVGFGSHITISNFDSNSSYETQPIDKEQTSLTQIKDIKGVTHTQQFAIKAGIIKTKTEIQGIVLKGVGSDYDWSFLKNYLIDGECFKVVDSVKSNKIIISSYVANLLNFKKGDNVIVYFIETPPRVRKFEISGIYQTNLEEFDRMYAFVDIAHVQKLNNWQPNQVSGIEISIDNFDRLHELSDSVYNVAGYKFDDKGGKLKVVNVEEANPLIFDWLSLSNINVIVILTLVIIVAGFNMISCLLILVLERINTIGVLKAIGLANKGIRKIFLYQSGFLILKGVALGNIIGVGLCLLQKRFGFIKLDATSYYMNVVPIRFNIPDLIILNAITVFLIILMLYLASHIVSKIDPVKSIRFE